MLLGAGGWTFGVIREIPLTRATGGSGAIAKSSWSRREIACPALFSERNFMRLPTMSGAAPAAASSTETASTTSNTADFGANRLPAFVWPTRHTGLPAESWLKATSPPVSVELAVTTALFGT